jgi:hypothetical protein
VRMDLRWGGADANRMRALAQELVGLQPDIIVTNGTPPAVALQRETRTIPIVFASMSDGAITPSKRAPVSANASRRGRRAFRARPAGLSPGKLAQQPFLRSIAAILALSRCRETGTRSAFKVTTEQ